MTITCHGTVGVYRHAAVTNRCGPRWKWTKLCDARMTSSSATTRDSSDVPKNLSEQDGLREPPKHDLVGPPHPISNLRQFQFHVPENESRLHRRLRELRIDTLNWSNEFWIEHNTAYAEGRQAFVTKLLKEKYADNPNKTKVSSKEMSVFYRDFLNKNWRSHINYNKEWQRRNFKILYLSLLVALERLIRRA